jgi:hypothetical protein
VSLTAGHLDYRHSPVRSSRPNPDAVGVTPVVSFTEVRPFDPQLRRSFHVLRPSAVILMSAGFLAIRLPPDVRGFRLVLARGWHDQHLVRRNLGSTEQS